jgi:hypothetical protein
MESSLFGFLRPSPHLKAQPSTSASTVNTAPSTLVIGPFCSPTYMGTCNHRPTMMKGQPGSSLGNRDPHWSTRILTGPQGSSLGNRDPHLATGILTGQPGSSPGCTCGLSSTDELKAYGDLKAFLAFVHLGLPDTPEQPVFTDHSSDCSGYGFFASSCLLLVRRPAHAGANGFLSAPKPNPPLAHPEPAASTMMLAIVGEPIPSHFPSRLNRISSFTKKTDQRNTVNPWKCRTDSKSIQPSLGETAKRRRRCEGRRRKTRYGERRWKERCGGVKGGFHDVLLQKWKRKGRVAIRVAIR